MGQDQDPGGFPAYLKTAIEAAGFANPTQFARKAKVEPTVVFAWLRGDRRPSIRLIERVAPVLGITIDAVVRAAYPEAVAGAAKVAARPATRELHPLADELDRLLQPQSPLTDEERQRVVIVVDASLAPYRARRRPRKAS